MPGKFDGGGGVVIIRYPQRHAHQRQAGEDAWGQFAPRQYMIGAAGVRDADRRKVVLMMAAGYEAIRSAAAKRALLEERSEGGRSR